MTEYTYMLHIIHKSIFLVKVSSGVRLVRYLPVLLCEMIPEINILYIVYEDTFFWSMFRKVFPNVGILVANTLVQYV